MFTAAESAGNRKKEAKVIADRMLLRKSEAGPFFKPWDGWMYSICKGETTSDIIFGRLFGIKEKQIFQIKSVRK